MGSSMKFALVLLSLFWFLYFLILDQFEKERKSWEEGEEEERAQSERAVREANEKRLQEDRLAREAARTAKATSAAAEEALRRVRRDLDHQDSPFIYEIGRHANETLALRYGIPNLENSRSEQPARSIELRKLRPAGMVGADGVEMPEKNVYLVELTRFRNRQALAVIVKGEEFVRTFYPMRQSWFDANSGLEEKLKGNRGFTLKEIAQFNILHSQEPP